MRGTRPVPNAHLFLRPSKFIKQKMRKRERERERERERAAVDKKRNSPGKVHLKYFFCDFDNSSKRKKRKQGFGTPPEASRNTLLNVGLRRIRARGQLSGERPPPRARYKLNRHVTDYRH